MRTPDVEPTLATIKADLERLIAGWPRDGRAAGRDGATSYPTLAATFAALDEWRGIGYPAGGWSGTRGGDDTPLPERLAIAGARDDHAAALLDMGTSLRLVAEFVHDLVVGVARHAPISGERARPVSTGTCGNKDATDSLLKGCGRVVACTAVDRLKRGLCPKCYTAWQRSFEVDVLELGDAAHFG